MYLNSGKKKVYFPRKIVYAVYVLTFGCSLILLRLGWRKLGLESFFFVVFRFCSFASERASSFSSQSIFTVLFEM